jgi:hypothetical protein
MRTSLVVITALGTLALPVSQVSALPGAQVSTAAPAAEPVLDKDSRALIAEAIAEGRDEVSLLVATRLGETSAVAARMTALGGSVAYRDDDVGYLRVRTSVVSAARVADVEGVVAVQVDELLDGGEPDLPDAEPTEGPAAPGPDTPPVNDYLPVGDIGAPQFIAANPTYDGRGITVGIVDDGVDMLTPELQSARLANGTVVPKIVDFVTTTDPSSPFAPDPTWIDMARQVTGKKGVVDVDGQTYVVPGNRTFRFGVFDERAVFAFNGDVDRDGNPPGSSGAFAVLWDTTVNRVWVDLDQDHTFTDQQAMTDYAVAGDVAVFGHDRAGTPERDSVPFVVQTDAKRKLVNINVATGDHGTAVASVAVGSSFFGGSMDGAAPEARLAMVRCNLAFSCIFEGILHLVKRDHVDLVNLSFGPASVPSRNGSQTVYTEIVRRVVDLYDSQVFAAAGNLGPTLESVGAPSTTQNVVSVGASARAASWESLFAFGGFPVESVAPFSSRGLTDDGALKPDIVAPGVTLVAVPAWLPPEFPRAGYQLPAGYAPFAGTSFSSPIATGGAALLLSAALQSGFTAKADQLRLAIYSGVRRLARGGVEDQGRGAMDVSAAWEVLRRKPAPVVVDVAAPVRTLNSQFLPTPHTGPGLYEREGWAPGDTGRRTITLTRRTGPGKPIAYKVSWTGNDGAFTAANRVVLPRGTPTALDIEIGSLTPGLHSAILNLDDPATPGTDAQVAVAVIAALDFDPANDFVATAEGSFPELFVAQRIFFRMPTVDARAVKMHVVEGPEFILGAKASAFGVPQIPFGTMSGDTFPLLEWPAIGPGVWELELEGPTGDYRVGLTALGAAAVDPTPVVFDPTTVGTEYTADIGLTATIGFRGSAVGGDLGPIESERLPLVESEGIFREIQVPAGASALGVRIDHPAGVGEDVDVYVFHCPEPGFCDLVDQAVSPTATEQSLVRDPEPGQWIIIVDPFDLEADTSAVDYATVVTAPSWGTLAVDDPPATHPPDEPWTATIRATPLDAPPSGVLGGLIAVESDGIRLWGGAQVELRNVS